LLRGTLLTALAELGHEATINEAVRRFHVFLEDRETPLLPPDVRKVSILTEFKLYLLQTTKRSTYLLILLCFVGCICCFNADSEQIK